LAAMGLSWRMRVDAGRPLDLPVLDLGPALVVLLPGESYVEFQLLAQQMRPDTFVVAVGYGEYVLAGVFAATVIVVLWLFTWLDNLIYQAEQMTGQIERL